MFNHKDTFNAEALWDQFYQKHDMVIPDAQHPRSYRVDIEEGNAAVDLANEKIKQKSPVPKKINSANDAAIVLQTNIPKNLKRIKNEDVTVFVQSKHQAASPAFRDFLNFKKETPVKKSLNTEKLRALHSAIHKPDWDAAILTDERLPELVLTLASKGMISQQQLESILERQQTLKDFPLKKMYKILEEDAYGNKRFTKEAEDILLPALIKRRISTELIDEQIEQYRLLIASLPLSEQYFYITEAKHIKTFTEEMRGTKVALGTSLTKSDTVILHNENEIIHTTSGARDAEFIVRFGIDEYIRPSPRLLSQKVKDIESGINKNKRYGATQFTNTSPYENGDIHEFENVTGFEAMDHDVYHSILMSTVPNPFLKAFNYLTELMRVKSGFPWSKEMWMWIDCEFIYFVSKKHYIHDYNDNQHMTELFCKMLDNKSVVLEKGIGFRLLNVPATLGTLAYIDMLSNPQKWKDEFKIVPEFLLEPYLSHYLQIKEIYELIKNDEPTLQVFKCKIYYILQPSIDVETFAIINDIINDQYKNKMLDLSFQKLDKNIIESEEIPEDLRNSIRLVSNKKTVSSEVLVKMVQNHHETAFSQENESQKKEAKDYFSSALVDHGLPISQAGRYSSYRISGDDHDTAQFKLKPALGNWIKANLGKTVLSFSTVVGIPCLLIYALDQVYQQEALNNQVKKTSQMKRETNTKQTLQQESSPSFFKQKQTDDFKSYTNLVERHRPIFPTKVR